MTTQTPRHQAILDRLEGRGRVRIGELSGELGVSEMTIRRDLETLEREGALQRVHGGATSIVSSSYEPPFAARAHRNADGKRAAAAAAARRSCGPATPASSTAAAPASSSRGRWPAPTG